ncbi:29918_t:CDS:2 [Gigaspora margarita]|uniref:29918_t:CDS:1 n=1 Tax=Gigaspora margarita TaxID=4874 RepID=A0ABN7UFH0_GIGMA|nr:29918_t:CDS:2 [Gigaspora margarita]
MTARMLLTTQTTWKGYTNNTIQHLQKTTTNYKANKSPLTKLTLGKLPKLKELGCPNNLLTTLNLSGCPNLEKLDCELTKINQKSQLLISKF